MPSRFVKLRQIIQKLSSNLQIMKKEKAVKPAVHIDSKELTPKRKQATKDWKEVALKFQEALSRIEQKLNQFLIENFSVVLDSTLDVTKYYNKLAKTIEDLKNSNIETVTSIFKKIKSMIDPLVLVPQRSPDACKDNAIVKLDQELRLKQQQLLLLSQETIKLRATLKAQLQKAQQNRQKQNRMTELLYILRKKNIDIDRIYQQNCQTPGTSKKNSLSEMDASSF